MRQREGVGEMLAALRFQDPQQQGGQVRAEALVGTGRPQQCPQAAAHLAAGDLAAQQGVAAIEQPVADGGEEMVRAEQVGDAPLTAAGDRFGPRLAQIAHDCDRVAKGGHSALDSGAQFAFVLRSDAHRVQHPAGPAVQAAERAATALVTGGIDVQGIAVGQGGPQGRGAVPMQSLQGRQEAIAQRGDGTGRKGEALAGQGRADLLALEVAVIAGQSDPHDQVPAVALAGRGQAGQLLRDRDSPGGAVPALLADLARPQRAGRQGDQHAGLALLRAQGPAAVGTLVPLGDEIDTRGSLQIPIDSEHPIPIDFEHRFRSRVNASCPMGQGRSVATAKQAVGLLPRKEFEDAERASCDAFDSGGLEAAPWVRPVPAGGRAGVRRVAGNR